MEPKRLYRSRSDRMVAGICAGLAHYANLDPTVMRVIFVLTTLATGLAAGIIAYIALWVVIPEEPGAVPLPAPPAA